MNYGKAFKEIRAERGLSRSETANGLGCTTSALSKIESGRNEPKNKTIKKFCEVAHIPIAYFYHKAFTMEDFSFPPYDFVSLL